MATKGRNARLSLDSARGKFTVSLVMQTQLSRGALAGGKAENTFHFLTISRSMAEGKERGKIRARTARGKRRIEVNDFVVLQ